MLKHLNCSYKFYACFLIALLFQLGTINICQAGEKVRRYQEEVVEAPQKLNMNEADPHAMLDLMPNDDIHAKFRMNAGDPMSGQLMDSVAATPLTWETPKEWLEKKGNGMRVATFISNETVDPVETSIVSLAGQAGGVSANAVRWIQQLKMTVPSEDVLNKFIDAQEKIKTPSGLSITILDFTQLQKDSGPETSSMIAAIVDGQQSQIFVKMTGSKGSVLKNITPFKTLLQSLKVN